MTDSSPNYDYVLQTALDLADIDEPLILDFGCGLGQAVQLGRKRGIDIWGADTFSDHYANWSEKLDPSIRARVRKISDDKIAFPDDHFDVVISNFVFEHIKNIPLVLDEINRVLKPGGALLTLFPTNGTWFEGHVGLYFPHWLNFSPALQWQYLRLMRLVGFGYYNQSLEPGDWASASQRTLNKACVYHSWQDVHRWWHEAFGNPPRSCEADFIRYRLSRHPKLKFLNRMANLKIASVLLTVICRIRAGRVFIVRSLMI